VKLVIFKGDVVKNEIHLAGSTLRIGRDHGNDVVLDDKGVSRCHAEVRAEGGTYFIVDLNSRNGIWLQGQQILGRAALALGVPVTLGVYELVLEDDLPTVFNQVPASRNQQAGASAPSGDEPGQPGRPATGGTPTPTAPAARRSD
jgi:pSer/pThr/pTyr-binding forkhead associated (FHA) protein